MQLSFISYLIMLILISMSFISCLPQKKFDEEAWRVQIANTKVEMLYAPHFKDGKFFNPWMPMEEKSFLTFLRWKFQEKQNYTEEEKSFLPKFIPNLKERIPHQQHRDFIAWIGHNTFLIRINGEYWLTDPIFSERALLPKRKVPPAITPEEIKALGIKITVLISHNHYDHFDRKSISDLPVDTRFFVPLGLKKVLHKMGRRNVIEMDWWQNFDCGNGITITCLPAQHWSRRIDQSVNETLWASYLIKTPDTTIYFGGDSGYFIGYKEFGRRFSNIHYALLPTTAYHPRWFMHYNHMNIQEVLQAFIDLNARFLIPTQWGTFHLGDEPPGYPALELKREIASRNLDRKRFIIMDIGQIIYIGKAQNSIHE